MNFTKSVLTNYQSAKFGNFEECNLYEIFDAEMCCIGQFIVSEKVAFIATNDLEYRINITHHYFKPNTYEIFEVSNNRKIGYYKIPEWITWFNEIGTLTLHQQSFSCVSLKPDVRFHLFKKATWAQHKILVFNQLTEIEYSLKVETEWIVGTDAEFRNAQGQIQTNNAGIDLILAGLLFMERKLNKKDASISQ